ncbi:MAG: helix-turn-helix domain-containing protein [Solirubrobacteraceae bacterium]
MTPADPAPVTSASGRGPSDRARLADALRAARHGKSLTGVQAGRRAGMSQSKVSKIERGFLLPSTHDVAALSDVYELDARAREELLALASGLREEASAKVILARNVAETQRRIEQLERSATRILSFQPTMIIGLLQTPAYQRLVFGIPDSHAVPEDEIDEAVAARTQRQTVLDDPSKRLTLIMTEGALRWNAGTATIMSDQINAIAAATTRPNVRIGLIPWTTPVHLFPSHGFHIYDDDAVIAATETATATLTGPTDIAAYRELFAALEASATFDDEAREHLERIRTAYAELAAS